MNTVRLGRTDLDITPVGFGCWAIGGGNWAYGWGPQNDHQAIEAIIAATELGINWIDTAAVYGLGHAEELVGEALRGMNNRPLIFTKCSLVWDTSRNVTNCLKADSILRECEASLKRLGIEAIDLYQVHWPNPDEDIEEGWQTLAKLQEEGLVRHIGVSNFSVEQMQRAEAIAPVASLQPPYSMLRRGIEEKILPYCQEYNIGVIVYSPMLSGMLSGAMTLDRAINLPKNDWRRNNKEFQEPRLSKNIALVELLRSIGRAYEASPGEVAIAWTLNNPAVTGAIVGGRSADQVKGTYGAASLRLTDEDIQAIEKFIASVAE